MGNASNKMKKKIILFTPAFISLKTSDPTNHSYQFMECTYLQLGTIPYGTGTTANLSSFEIVENS
jgi:hypothetical protein